MLAGMGHSKIDVCETKRKENCLFVIHTQYNNNIVEQITRKKGEEKKKKRKIKIEVDGFVLIFLRFNKNHTLFVIHLCVCVFFSYEFHLFY